MWGALYEYAAALWQHWLWIMTGGPFAAEKVAKAIWPDRYEAWMSRYAAPATRARLTALVAIIGIFVASFLAFNDERNLALRATEQAAQASGFRSFPHRPLSSSELGQLYRSMSALPHPRMLIAAVTSDISSAKLARQVYECLRPLGIIKSPNVTEGWIEDEDDYGISLEIRDPSRPSQSELNYLNAFKAAGLAARFTRLPDFVSSTYDLVLFIGPNRDQTTL